MTSDFKFIHQVYFKLTDRRSATRDTFVSLCEKYLSPTTHKGMCKLTLALRAVEMTRPVNDTEFDVLMEMEFENFDGYLDYAQHWAHDQWITEAGSMSTQRRVFDSYEVNTITQLKGAAP